MGSRVCLMILTSLANSASISSARTTPSGRNTAESTPTCGFGYARQGMVAPVEVKWDEKPVTDGRATVRCTYQGKVKIYQIN